MEKSPKDPFDMWSYRAFRLVLFIIGLYWMWKFLEDHVPVRQVIAKLFGY